MSITVNASVELTQLKNIYVTLTIFFLCGVARQSSPKRPAIPPKSKTIYIDYVILPNKGGNFIL